MFDYKKLTEVIRQGIGEGTLAGFARKCGIAPRYLNKLMDADKPARPSKTTLERLASCTETSYDELLVICGYVESRTTLRRKRPEEEWADLNAQEMETGFKEMTQSVHPYHSIRDFLEEYAMLYSMEDITFQIGPTTECDDDRAEFFVPCTITFHDKDFECTTWFAIFYYRTVGGRYFITETAMDAGQLKELGIGSENREDARYIYRLKYRLSAEEMLINAFFGQDSREYPFTMIGFGFDFNAFPAKFDSFIEAHKDAIPEGYDIKALHEDPDIEVKAGFLIARIMSRETGLPFNYYQNEREKEHGSIMVPDGQYELEDIKPITRQYAKELGIPRYGECVVYTTALRDARMSFKTNEEI